MAPTSELLFSLLISFTWSGQTHAKAPNIVFILADDYGWNDVGYHGSEIHTPTLDKLAAEGVKLENYYVQPICSPTRGQLMSGRYQIHTGLQHGNMAATHTNCLPLNLPTLANRLHDQGYATHMIGKWHLGFYKKQCTPTYRGFDSFFGYLTANEDYYSHVHCWSHSRHGQHLQECGLDLRDNLEPVWNQNGTYSAHMYAARAEQLVANHSRLTPDKPFFLYLPFQSVHGPLQVPQKYADKYAHIQDEKRRTYAGMVSAMDEAIANITAALQTHNMWNDTVLIFSTDNGGQVKEGGNNWPLRGWKKTLWEGGMRAVGFVHSPRLEKTGVENAQLMHVTDWFPTLVSLAGGNTTGLQLDGYNVWDAISRGDESPRKEILHNIDSLFPSKGHALPGSPFDVRVRSALRVGNWKIITGNPGGSGWKPPPPLGDATLYFEPGALTDDPDKNLWLFDVKDDPNEKKDVSALYPKVVQMMLNRLAAYNATVVPCIQKPYDPRSNPKLHGGVWGPWVDDEMLDGKLEEEGGQSDFLFP